MLGKVLYIKIVTQNGMSPSTNEVHLISDDMLRFIVLNKQKKSTDVGQKLR
jgi:hypothetical protein